VVVFLVGLHLNPLEVHQPVPYLLSFLAAIGLVVRQRKTMPKRQTYYVALFLGVALVCTLIAPRPEYMGARIVSLTYLFASITGGFALYLELRHWPRNLISKYVGIGATILLMGATLEISLEPIREVSDFYRYWNFAFPYANDWRDVLYHGSVRPKFFSSEPSYLADSMVFLLTAWLFVSTRPRKFLIFWIGTFLALYLLRSPLLVILPIAAAVYVLDVSRIRQFGMNERGVRVVGGSLTLVLFLFGSTLMMWEAITPRIEQILSGNDMSTAIRIWASFAIVPELLSYNPITGIGVGGTEAFAYDVIARQFAELGSWLVSTASEQGTLEHLIENFVANYVISFGVVGGVLGIIILIRFIGCAAPRKSWQVWPLFFLFALAHGPLNGLVIWTIFFSLPLMLKSSTTEVQATALPTFPTQDSKLCRSLSSSSVFPARFRRVVWSSRTTQQRDWGDRKL